MSKTPAQTIINESDDPGLVYLTPKVANTVLSASVKTDQGTLTTQFVPVTQQVVNLFNDNTIVNVTNEVAGSSGELQFNVGGHFSSDSDFRYNSQTDTLSIKNLILSGTITFSDSTTQSSASTGGGLGFSGSYNDLTNKPTIPSISGLASETYVNNAVSAITIPTDVSDLTDNNNLLGQGGGTTYDQSLNTTDSPSFNNLALSGELLMPNYVKQTSPGYTTCPANQDTVIFTSTESWYHTIKLVVQVEGQVGGLGLWETQSCEIVVVKSSVNNKVAGSVYGLVYTSDSPLATFTTRWNSLTSRVEVVCTPASTIYAVIAHTFAIELATAD